MLSGCGAVPKWEWPYNTFAPMIFVYSAVLAVALIVTLPYWVLQMLRGGKYRAGLRERLGSVPARLRDGGKPTIWVHAVSVGEVLAVSGILQQLQQRYLTHRVVISTTTATGQKLARERFGDENVFFFPLDFSFAVRPYLDALRPELVVVAETELWPNFFRLARARGAKICVINARVSDRSFPRYRFVTRWLGPVLDNVSLFLAQSRGDAGRLVAIGAAPGSVEDVGNLKFDVPSCAEKPIVAQLRKSVSGPVIVAGSTVEGEEQAVVTAFASVVREFGDATLVLAPRHPERFPAVAALAQQLAARDSISFTRRTRWKGEAVRGIFLLDTIGELGALYSIATIAFVGGSLVPRGGHNVIEAARFGVPVIVAPHTENFRDIINLFRAAGAVEMVSSDGLCEAFLALMRDQERRHQLGLQAQSVWRANAGATERTLARINALLHGAGSPILFHQENA